MLNIIIRGINKILIKPIKNIYSYLYCAYLTLIYVDEYEKFPAFKFSNDNLMKLKINKVRQSKLIIKGQLILEPFFNTSNISTIHIGTNAILSIENDFTIGDEIKILLSKNSKLILKGKRHESASGITGRSVILVFRYIELSYDVLIAWNTFVTDSDWHPVEGTSHHADTIIGDHVWVAVGAKVLKGVRIGNDSIVGTSAVVMSGDYPTKSLLAGIPAKVVKSEIPPWTRELGDNFNATI